MGLELHSPSFWRAAPVVGYGSYVPDTGYEQSCALKRPNGGLPSGPGDRETATGATVALAIAKGASIVRVHDVAGAISVARTTDAIVRFR